MPFYHHDDLKYFSFSSLEIFPVIQGIFTRHGGVSPAPWNSLNVGGNNGDLKENVIENRKKLFDVFNLDVETLFDVWQVHSSSVIITDRPRPLNEPHQKADAIITNQRGITLFMRFGDCVPIFLFDPVKSVIGLVHAGWPGTVQKIVLAAINAMTEKYNTSAKDLIACIGPSIGPDHYPIGEDVISLVKSAFRDDAEQILFCTNGHIHFDLWKANQLLLQSAGVHQIELANICTACHVTDWYSHRAEKGKTGRFGAIFALR